MKNQFETRVGCEPVLSSNQLWLWLTRRNWFDSCSALTSEDWLWVAQQPGVWTWLFKLVVNSNQFSWLLKLAVSNWLKPVHPETVKLVSVTGRTGWNWLWLAQSQFQNWCDWLKLVLTGCRKWLSCSHKRRSNWLWTFLLATSSNWLKLVLPGCWNWLWLAQSGFLLVVHWNLHWLLS